MKNPYRSPDTKFSIYIYPHLTFHDLNPSLTSRPRDDYKVWHYSYMYVLRHPNTHKKYVVSSSCMYADTTLLRYSDNKFENMVVMS